MADISKIKTPDGTTYNIKDATARSQSGVTGVKGNAESSYRTGNVNLTAANVGAVATSGNETVAGNKTFSGTTTLSVDSTYPTTSGTIVPASPTAIIQSPIPKFLWHDIFAFCRASTPKYYTTTDGTTWVEATLEKRLFSQQEAWGTTTVLNSTIKGSRWEWPSGSGFYASLASWLVLGITYTNPVSRFDLLLETSSDSGTTWTTLCNPTNINYNQTPIWIKLSGTCQNAVRLTITNNSASASGASLGICSIKLLTHRWGNQGKGSEFEHPYQWDGDGNVTPIVGGSILATKVRQIASTSEDDCIPNEADAMQVYRISASGSTATGADGHIIGFTWTPANKYGAQLYIDTDPTYNMSVRQRSSAGVWQPWKKIFTENDTIAVANGGTGATTATNARTNLGVPPTSHASSATTYGVGNASNYGHLKLSTSTSSTSAANDGTAATPSAVKTAYDLADTANGTANTALSGVNGSLIYDHTYTISNGVATFTPHVYCKGEEVTTNYAKSCFVWKYKLASQVTGTPSYVALTTNNDRTCTVTISTLGYGGYVLGEFTPA